MRVGDVVASVHCWLHQITVGCLKLAHNPNFSSQLKVKNQPRDGLYFEKLVSWDCPVMDL